MQFQLLDSSLTVGNGKDIHDLIGIYGGLMISFISVMLTIVTFLLGFIVANWISKRKEREELENIKNMFLKYYKSFIESKKIQIENYEKLKHSILGLEQFEIVEMKNISFNYDFFDALDKERLYKSLNGSDIDLYEFFSMHSHFKKVDNEMILFYQALMDRLRNRNDNLNSVLNNIEAIMGKLYSSKDIFSSDEMKMLRLIHTNENITHDSKLGELKDEYINPLLEIIIKKYNESKATINEFVPIMQEFNRGLTIIGEFEFIKQDAANNIDNNIKQLNRPIIISK